MWLASTTISSKSGLEISKAIPIYSAHRARLILLYTFDNTLPDSKLKRFLFLEMFLGPAFKSPSDLTSIYFSLYSFICYNERCMLISEPLSIWNILHCFHLFKTFLYLYQTKRNFLLQTREVFAFFKAYKTIFTHVLWNSPHTELYDD